MIEFPSIGQYRQVIKAIHERAAYVGRDENDNPIYKSVSEPLPIINYVGSTKIHGTNSSVVQSNNGEITFQSRNRVITPEKDNMGFAAFCQPLIKNDFWAELFEFLRDAYDLGKDTVIIYGEWCANSVQQGVALSQLPEKHFIVFGIAVAVNEEITRWVSPNELSGFLLSDLHERIHSIYEYPTFNLTIDFNNPALSQNELVRLTNEVEKECPVGKAFGVSGVGEGIVWRPINSDFDDPKFWFKVKGEEHSVSKVKVLAEVDLEKLNSIKELVECVVTHNRCNQGLDYLDEMGKEIDKTSTSFFLSWVVGDIAKEESDRIAESGLDLKEINKQIGIAARKWFFEWLEKNV